jgi:hypothetical protein
VACEDIIFDENRSTGSNVQAGKHTYRLLCSLKGLLLLRSKMCYIVVHSQRNILLFLVSNSIERLQLLQVFDKAAEA